MTIRSRRKTKNMSINKMVGIGILIFFSATLFYSFVISPDMGEKILYGKNPPSKMYVNLEYGEIIISGNYSCMESASQKAPWKLEKVC
ncbi:hypothetical protein [Nitrosopumilus sp.]|uniref:hypothetical protein n=1 Tax=Nitrosopumilus sp. TaxID=2024843 RepID=UPI003B5A7DD3